MADDVTVDNGGLADYDVKTDDDAGGKHYQLVKLAFGPANTFTWVESGVGLPVSVQNGSIVVADGGGSITVDGTVGISGSVTVVDGGGSITVDGTVAVTDGGGSITVDGTVAVSGNVTIVDGGGSITVDGSVSITGTPTVDTELPAAAALTDNFANPTAPAVGAFLMGWDGAQWDRISGTGGRLQVAGGQAEDAGVIGNPLPGGGRASSAIPTAMSADGDAVFLWLDRSGGTIINGRDAHDAALNANSKPLAVGGRASDAVPTAVSADGDAVWAWMDRRGALKTVMVDDAGDSAMDGTNNALRVNVVAGSGGATQYAEDTASAGGESVIMVGVVRKDSAGTLVDADLDRSELQVDASGALRVTGGGGGTEYTEDVAAPADPVGNAQILRRRDTPASEVTTDGDWIAQNATQYGAGYVQILTSAGAFVDSFGGGTQYAEDTAKAAGEQLTMAGVIRADAAASQVDADGDRTELIVDASGRLHVNVGNTVVVSATDLDIRNLTNVDVVTVEQTTAANLNARVVGFAAHDGAGAAVNPLAIGGFASAAAPADVSADVDVVRAWFLRNGAQATVLTAAGALIGGDATNGLDVDVTRVQGTVTVSATDLDIRNLDVAQDDVRVGGMAAHDVAVADNPVAIGARASDAVPTSVSADGDAVWLWATREGALAVNLRDAAGTEIANVGGALSVDLARFNGIALGASTGLPIGDGTFAVEVQSSGADGLGNTVNELTTAALGYLYNGASWDRARGNSTGGAFVQGNVAHDAAVTGNPILAGAQMETMADSAPGTRAGTDGDAVKLASIDGAQYVITTGPQTFHYHDDDTSAVTTDGTVHAAPGSGLSLYITDIVFSIGVATASSIFIEESTTKVLGPYYLEAIAGRGLSIHFTTPKKITANTAALVTNTGATTFGIDIHGFIAPG